MEKAIGMIEFNSISKGIYVADQMVKTSDVNIVTATSVCPGKYISIVHGDVSAVETSVNRGVDTAGEFLVDHIVIPNVHPAVFPAIVGATMPDEIRAIGIIESYSLASMIITADAIVKVADLTPIELRLGTGLGGKSFFVFTGDVADVKTGINKGKDVLSEEGLMINAEVIPSPSKRFIDTLF
jgi:Carbon dioxide concentrating mechanism/carboxysome shell protein